MAASVGPMAEVRRVPGLKLGQHIMTFLPLSFIHSSLSSQKNKTKLEVKVKTKCRHCLYNSNVNTKVCDSFKEFLTMS